MTITDSNNLTAADGLIRVQSAARLLDCCRETVYRMVNRGDLTAIHFGADRRITRASLSDFINRNTVRTVKNGA